MNSPTNLLKEIKRILKVDGILIIITPNFKYALKNFYDDPTHRTPYTHISIKKILKLHEFQEIEVFPFLIQA